MKIDIDSIFYIILSIIILVVSGLGSRRKKLRKTLPSSAQAGTREPEDIAATRPRRPVIDPFERLEQILTGQSQYESMEGESLEVLEDEEQIIMDEKEKIQSTQSREIEQEKRDLTDVKEDEDVKNNLDGLFGDVNEITRAFIYSEIFPRKYI